MKRKTLKLFEIFTTCIMAIKSNILLMYDNILLLFYFHIFNTLMLLK